MKQDGEEKSETKTQSKLKCVGLFFKILKKNTKINAHNEV